MSQVVVVRCEPSSPRVVRGDGGAEGAQVPYESKRLDAAPPDDRAVMAASDLSIFPPKQPALGVFVNPLVISHAPRVRIADARMWKALGESSPALSPSSRKGGGSFRPYDPPSGLAPRHGSCPTRLAVAIQGMPRRKHAPPSPRVRSHSSGATNGARSGDTDRKSPTGGPARLPQPMAAERKPANHHVAHSRWSLNGTRERPAPRSLRPSGRAGNPAERSR